MDYGNMLGESFEYAKEGLVGKWMKWLLLLVATILLALPLLGYELKILRGEKPAPEVSDWGTLFIDGIKYLVISLIYAIPVIILIILAALPAIMSIVSGNTSAALAAMGGFFVALLVILVLAVIIALIQFIGIVRFARTGKMGEAFNFGEILTTIEKIGWVPYILGIIIMIIVIGVVEFILSLIPYVGGILVFLLIPFFVMFQAHYLCELYDSTGTA